MYNNLVDNVNIEACKDICRYNECMKDSCELYRALKTIQKEEYIKRLEQGYQKIVDVITPYLSDFTGVGEDGKFDLIKAIEELLIEKKSDSSSVEKLKKKVSQLEFYRNNNIELIERQKNDIDRLTVDLNKYRRFYEDVYLKASSMFEYNREVKDENSSIEEEEMNEYQCPYSGECSIVNACSGDCYIKQEIEDRYKAEAKLHKQSSYVYVCYQAENRSIMSITDNEQLAKETCCNNDDAYVKIELNKNYGRDDISTDDIAIYNMDGVFTTKEGNDA